MTSVERSAFLKLFNRGGYVLDFSTNSFDIFTIPYTEIDTEEAAREVDRRLAMEREYLYVLALKEWAESDLSSRTIKTDEAAADNGGCTTDQTQINSE